MNSSASPTTRSEELRQRAVALGLIQDDGPLSPEELERDRDRHLAVGVTEDQLCDMLEELLEAEEGPDLWVVGEEA